MFYSWYWWFMPTLFSLLVWLCLLNYYSFQKQDFCFFEFYYLLSLLFVFSWIFVVYLFSHPFTFNLPVMLYVKWDSWVWVGFVNPLANTRLLSDVFRPFAFNLITDILEFIFHLIFYFLVLLFFYLSFISFLSSCGLHEQFLEFCCDLCTMFLSLSLYILFSVVVLVLYTWLITVCGCQYFTSSSEAQIYTSL